MIRVVNQCYMECHVKPIGFTYLDWFYLEVNMATKIDPPPRTSTEQLLANIISSLSMKSVFKYSEKPGKPV